MATVQNQQQFFEDVFMPFIIFNVENKNDRRIGRIYQYIEDLICSNDKYATNVVEVSIIENMNCYDISEKLKSFLKPKSLESYNKTKY